MIKRWGGLIIVLLLAGCTLLESSPAPDTPGRDDLLRILDEAQRDQAAALALWDRIIFGKAVSCQEFIPVPDMITVTAQDDDLRAVQDQLNAAIQALHNSSDLWNIECNAARDYVPLSMAKEGRTAALAAGPPLATAAALLAAYSG